jgi:prepilin-type N-terminal cleavage/methylation domain-containing protein
MSLKLQRGFSLLETMVAMAVLLGVGGIVMSGMVQLMRTQATIANRTEMHSSVRSATELLQQEIGQAGKVSMADPTVNVTMGAVLAGSHPIAFNTVPAPKVYPNEYLTIDVGSNQETVQVTGALGSPSATFLKAHPLAATPVFVLGAFSTGVVPPTAAPASFVNGSTGNTLKLYGDINGDGNMVYVEYTVGDANGTPWANCSGAQANPGFLYRHQMPYDQAAAKTANDQTMVLLNNVLPNPNDAGGNAVPCFSYQVQSLGTSGYAVVNVAVTLTVRTQNRDQQTGVYQPETKALLNIGPRNVVEVYDTASLTDPLRAQPMPTTVTNLLP